MTEKYGKMTMKKQKQNLMQLIVWLLVILFAGCGPDFDNPIDPHNDPDGIALVQVGWQDYETGRLDEAFVKFRQAFARNAENADARVGIGWSLFQKQDVQAAINEFQQALAMDGNAVDAHVGLAGAFLATEEYSSAIEHAQAVLSQQPDYMFAHDPLITSRNLHLVLAQGYFYLDDFARAQDEINIVDASIEINPENAESDLLRALEELTQSVDGR